MKTIVITGASSGIGWALMQAWIDRAHIVALYHPNDSFPFTHPNLHKVPVDLSDAKANDEALHTLPKVIDIFIANAGYARYEKNGFDHEAFRAMYQTNVWSVIAEYQWLKMHHPNAQFVVMLSAMAFWPLPGYAMYASTKAALDGYFKAVHLEDDMAVLRVYPVAVNTAFFDTSKQPHQSWLIQDANDVARKIIKAIQRGKKTLHTSALFKWTYRIIPQALNFYIKREQIKFKENLL